MCFQMLEFETSKSNSEVSKSNSNLSFSKTTLLQRETFLTMFYAINSSPLIAKHVSFNANNYFDQLQIVSGAFKNSTAI